MTWPILARWRTNRRIRDLKRRLVVLYREDDRMRSLPGRTTITTARAIADLGSRIALIKHEIKLLQGDQL